MPVSISEYKLHQLSQADSHLTPALGGWVCVWLIGETIDQRPLILNSQSYLNPKVRILWFYKSQSRSANDEMIGHFPRCLKWIGYVLTLNPCIPIERIQIGLIIIFLPRANRRNWKQQNSHYSPLAYSHCQKLNINSGKTVADFKIVLQSEFYSRLKTLCSPPFSSGEQQIGAAQCFVCQAQGRSNAGKFMFLISIDFPGFSTPPLFQTFSLLFRLVAPELAVTFWLYQDMYQDPVESFIITPSAHQSFDQRSWSWFINENVKVCASL